MKINAEYYFKVFCVLILIFTSHINSASFGMVKKNMKKTHQDDSIGSKDNTKRAEHLNPDLPNQPIHFQDWVKYLHYGDDDAKKPKAFFKNTQYDLQKRGPVAGQQSQDTV
jgi:hypothetical protein